jgi:hypothetical protein
MEISVSVKGARTLENQTIEGGKSTKGSCPNTSLNFTMA